MRQFRQTVAVVGRARARVCMRMLISRQETGCGRGVALMRQSYGSVSHLLNDDKDNPHNLLPQPSTRRDIMHPQSDRTEAEVRAAMRALVRAESLVQALTQMQMGEPRLNARPERPMIAQDAEVMMWRFDQGARGQAQKLAKAQKRMRALVAQERVQVWVEARAPGQMVTQAELVRAQAEAKAEAKADPVTYGEVHADPTLMEIIYSLKGVNGLRLNPQNWWLIQLITPITRLPPELLQQILLIVIDKANHSPLPLMQVSKLWYTMVTGAWASLRLGPTTPKNAITSKLERNQWIVDVLVDTEIDRGHFIPAEGVYQAFFAAIEATSRWRSFVVETFPVQADLPEHVVNRGLQRCSDPVLNRLRIFKIKCPCEMSPLLERLLRILGTTASGELTTVEIRSPSVISFLAPTYPSIFHSVKVLCLDTPRLPNPVDLLPHLHQLEALTASHLSFPNYHNDVNIPFVHTLRHLTLRAVSIQWMTDRTFHVLESCTILFPLHHHVLHTFSTTLPNCKNLTLHGYPLEILHGVSAHSLTQLSVTSSCSDKSRGGRLLVRFASQALRESRLAPRTLHISIEAMSWAWTKAFAFMTSLEELVIESAQPSSLGVKALRSLVVHPVHANNLDTTATHGGGNAPVCPSLKLFGLRYRRWLRPSEQFDLIPEFMFILWSRQRSRFPLQSFLIWKESEQKDPLELIEGSWINFNAFKHLANNSTMKEEDLFQLVLSRSVENLFKPCPLPHALKNCN